MRSWIEAEEKYDGYAVVENEALMESIGEVTFGQYVPHGSMVEPIMTKAEYHEKMASLQELLHRHMRLLRDAYLAPHVEAYRRGEGPKYKSGHIKITRFCQERELPLAAFEEALKRAGIDWWAR